MGIEVTDRKVRLLHIKTIAVYLIQLLLPLRNNDKQKFPTELFESVRHELLDRFGGVTAFVRSPAVGLWKESDEVERDEVVMFEVLAANLEADWWAGYRKKLEDRFRQDEVLIWGTRIKKL